MTPAEKLAKYGPIVLECNSKSEPDKTHFVRCKDGAFSCTCKGWIFNRDKPKRCKHTDRAQQDDGPAFGWSPLKVAVAITKGQKEPMVRPVRKITFDD
jgi:hypothetical protein